jgi:hypothetical protein
VDHRLHSDDPESGLLNGNKILRCNRHHRWCSSTAIHDHLTRFHHRQGEYDGAAAQPLTETAYQIVITADSANTGNVFIGGPGMVASTRVGVGPVLAKGIQISLDQYGGQLTLDDLWVDTDVSGSKLLVTLVG